MSCKSFYIPLSTAKHFEKLAQLRGVSKVARGEQTSSQTVGGFFKIAKSVQGNIEKLKTKKVSPTSDQTWWERRNNFCKRHSAQQKAQGTPYVETSGPFEGTPSRRQLGMICWLCSNITNEALIQMIPRVKRIIKEHQGKQSKSKSKSKSKAKSKSK
jgi:hypothetical protein